MKVVRIYRVVLGIEAPYGRAELQARAPECKLGWLLKSEEHLGVSYPPLICSPKSFQFRTTGCRLEAGQTFQRFQAPAKRAHAGVIPARQFPLSCGNPLPVKAGGV